MRYNINLKKVILPVVALVVLLIPFSSISATEQKYPESINDLPVFFVKTAENTAWLDSGEVTLVLLDKTSSTCEESVEKLKLDEYLAKNPLPEGWSIEVYGGKGTSKEKYEKVHEENNEASKKHGSVVLASAALLGEDTVKTTKDLPENGTFAIVQNINPWWPLWTYTTAHEAFWYAPTVSDNQEYWSALLINGVTNVDNFFLQSGQLYIDGEGYNVWSDSNEDYEPQYFDLDYVTNHYYSYGIVYISATDGWWMGCQDWTADEFDYYIEYDATGTRFINHNGTGVFFENWNTTANWYQGFTGSINVLHAEEYYDGDWQEWDQEEIDIRDSSGDPVANNGIITGSLVSDGTATWHLDDIVLAE